MDNKTVIISCAGMGKRFGKKMPKALIEVDGKAMIIRTLELLDEVDDVRVVVGYKANKVIEKVNSYRKDVTFVFNHDYTNNGTGASVSLAMKYAKKFILTIDGDIIIHPDDMKKILNMDTEFVGVCSISTDEPVLTITKNGKVLGFSREKGNFEWTGVTLLDSKRAVPTDGNVYEMVEPLLPLDYKILRLKEIDTMNDYKVAVDWVKNNYK